MLHERASLLFPDCMVWWVAASQHRDSPVPWFGWVEIFPVPTITSQQQQWRHHVSLFARAIFECDLTAFWVKKLTCVSNDGVIVQNFLAIIWPNLTQTQMELRTQTQPVKVVKRYF